ncbi:MAG: hypothetical protein M5U27_16300 [Gaiella sp.]|nr:hypothetical protein [Gaiella sp.]
MIDLHAHLLPGLDDGARNLDDALAIARSLRDDGVEVVAATPHVRDDYPTTPDAMESGVQELRRAVREADLDLEIVPGGEIALERLDELDDDSRGRFGLGGNPRLLLVEFPYLGFPRRSWTAATASDRRASFPSWRIPSATRRFRLARATWPAWSASARSFS